MAKSHTRPVRSARRLVIEATYRFDTSPAAAACFPATTRGSRSLRYYTMDSPAPSQVRHYPGLHDLKVPATLPHPR